MGTLRPANIILLEMLFSLRENANIASGNDQMVDLELDDGLAVLTIDRPHARNAISLDTMAELEKALDALDAAKTARALVITGAGDRAFVSGGDLKELSAIRTIEEASAMAWRMRTICDRFAQFPAPVIAALNGHAFGGGAEVAVAADIRVAADDIKIAFNQVSLEIMPAWGGAERLAALVGPGKALLLAGTGTVARRRGGAAHRPGGPGVAPGVLRRQLARDGQVAGEPSGGRDKAGNHRGFARRSGSVLCAAVGFRRTLAGRGESDEASMSHLGEEQKHST